MTYEDLAEKWLMLAQRNTSHMASPDACGDVLKGEGRVLWLLLENESGTTAGKIGTATGNTSGRVANLLKQLETKGLVYRRQGSDDKRKTLVYLTEAGKKKARQVKHDNILRESNVLKTLGAKDAKRLIELFKEYLDAKATLETLD